MTTTCKPSVSRNNFFFKSSSHWIFDFCVLLFGFVLTASLVEMQIGSFFFCLSFAFIDRYTTSTFCSFVSLIHSHRSIFHILFFSLFHLFLPVDIPLRHFVLLCLWQVPRDSTEENHERELESIGIRRNPENVRLREPEN